jgi:hypothetical protein
MRLAPCLLYNLGDIATRAAQPKASKQKQVTSVKKLTEEGEDKLTVMSSLFVDAHTQGADPHPLPLREGRQVEII